MENSTTTYHDSAQSTKNNMIYVFAGITLVGFCGNVKVVTNIFSNGGRWRFKLKNVTDIFIVNLAFADLSVMLVIPVLIAKMVIGRWMLGLIACKFYMTFDGVAKFVSVAFIVLLSFDRYLAICHPLKSRGVRTSNFGNLCASAAWAIVVLLMTPIFIVTKLHIEENSTFVQCAIPSSPSSVSLNDIFVMYNFTLNYFLPLILIIFFYVQIMYALRKRHRKFVSTTITNDERRRSRRGGDNNKRMTLLILLIVLTYTFCWMPYWILQFCILFDGQAFYELLGDEYFPMFSFLAYALQMTNSALNPYFYLASVYFRNVSRQKGGDLASVVTKARKRGDVVNCKDADTVTLVSSV